MNEVQFKLPSLYTDMYSFQRIANLLLRRLRMEKQWAERVEEKPSQIEAVVK